MRDVAATFWVPAPHRCGLAAAWPLGDGVWGRRVAPPGSHREVRGAPFFSVVPVVLGSASSPTSLATEAEEVLLRGMVGVSLALHHAVSFCSPAASSPGLGSHITSFTSPALSVAVQGEAPRVLGTSWCRPALCPGWQLWAWHLEDAQHMFVDRPSALSTLCLWGPVAFSCLRGPQSIVRSSQRLLQMTAGPLPTCLSSAALDTLAPSSLPRHHPNLPLVKWLVVIQTKG